MRTRTTPAAFGRRRSFPEGRLALLEAVRRQYAIIRRADPFAARAASLCRPYGLSLVLRKPAAAYGYPRSLRVAVFDDVAPTSPARRNGALSRDSGSQLAPRLRPKSPGEPRPPRSIGHTGEWAAGQRVSTFLARWGGISPFVHLRLVGSRGPAARSVLTDIRSAETATAVRWEHQGSPLAPNFEIAAIFSRSTSPRR